MLRLSNGRGNEAILIPWKWEMPTFCEISWNGTEYVLNATYAIEVQNQAAGDGFAGVDLGEIHPAVVATEQHVIIANGRELRSKRRYQNKVKAHFQRKMDKCKKRSKRWKKLCKAKQRVLGKLNNQINDILHKQTTKLVHAITTDGVRTVGIGDLRNLRQNVDYGKKANQKIHQMPSGRVRDLLTYKLEHAGVKVVIINEAYSTQTCPRCLEKNKTSSRNYKCKKCGLKYHRDGIGAVNIRQKTKYQQYVAVVGDMAPPVGVRYSA
jgi:putative transposase